ncbi:MAG: DNA polymerase III subunit alpha [Rhizobiales bacterium]|nr:DNA polymerase III subunit alpha [Hyphomicrobiales bacterium]
MSGFAELCVASNFSFLRGASHGAELVSRAKALGLSAIGIADRNTMAGVVRAHVAAKEQGLRLLVGTRLVTTDGFEVVAYPQDRAAYARLTKLLTLGNRRATKGDCHLTLDDIIEAGQGQCFIAIPPATPTTVFTDTLRLLAKAHPSSVWLALTPHYDGSDARRFRRLQNIAHDCRAPLLATNDALYHGPERRALQDVLTCIREHVTLETAGHLLEANAERHLKSEAEMARLCADMPDALAQSLILMDRCRFSLDELRYEYPADTFSDHETPQELLERLAWEGAATRFPHGVPPDIAATLRRELVLIESKQYAPYFLTVHDMVREARRLGILCQGRGSAANSVVCFCLGITSVNPTEVDLLFERFISTERNEPPDIDIDFEHERREEVMQYIYRKYGRDRAGIAATVISYRSRSAVRDVGKVFGLSEDVVQALSRSRWGSSNKAISQEDTRSSGLDPGDPRLAQTLALTEQLLGFPRHLSQHVGGFVITRGRLDEVVPIGNAAMAERTFVEWDKDDLDALGILKVDVLALGMLSCIRKAFDLLRKHHGVDLDLASVPQNDTAVYDMLCEADSVGVFQVESRAQMSMLPRLRPRNFYDLVIEVAIVRPGPIQGGMVHPYLKRRADPGSVIFPSPALENVLKKTLGIPLFQEQAMKMAIVAADYTPGEADHLRRAMATFRRTGTIGQHREKFISGMLKNGYDADFTERCFRQIEGFADYGFPESHAASFALLVYVSAWIKCHYPDVFCAAILNAQPMGFYAAAQLVRDARAHGVEIRDVDVNHSDWDCTLESTTDGSLCAVRLGFRQVRGLSVEAGHKLGESRGAGFDSVRHLWLRTQLQPRQIERLADADAFRSLGLDRRAALWAVRGLGGYDNGQGGKKPAALPLFAALEEGGFQHEAEVALPAMPLGEHVVLDYATLRLSLKAHPMSFLRARCAARGIVTNEQLNQTMTNKARVHVAGLVLVRQRPGTASGVIFATLEDETGIANIIIWPKVYERYRRTVLTSRLYGIKGRLQKEGIIVHVIADEIEDLTHELATISTAEDPGHKPDTQTMTTPRHQAHQLREAKFIPKSRDFH